MNFFFCPEHQKNNMNSTMISSILMVTCKKMTRLWLFFMALSVDDDRDNQVDDDEER